ncbi:MAG: hypothetical protein GYA18_08005 [Chloroflexi bacterium]|nr:hypothetical protein [Chloroflexota bacterium]
MTNVPSPNDLVLVCIIPQPRDLEIARVLGWYRIPLKHAPKVIYTDCLAFYQPSSFGREHRWKIEHVAQVRGVELTKRKELLRDEVPHPRAEDEYYKINLGDLVKLPSPIRAENWKRITFFYTTGELLSRAHTLVDLVIGYEEKALFNNTIMEYRRKYAHMQLPQEDIQLLQNEIMEYVLSLNALVKDQTCSDEHGL